MSTKDTTTIKLKQQTVKPIKPLTAAWSYQITVTEWREVQKTKTITEYVKVTKTEYVTPLTALLRGLR
jgi:hypothetical protein